MWGYLEARRQAAGITGYIFNLLRFALRFQCSTVVEKLLMSIRYMYYYYPFISADIREF